MLISADDIAGALRSLGVREENVLFVHSGLHRAARVEGRSSKEKMDTIVEGLRTAVPAGNVIMPTFTYSFFDDESFAPAATPSTVGMLTEHFRSLPDVRRTTDPILSAAISGRVPKEWEQRLFGVGDKDCFGEDSVFAYLRGADGKLVFFDVGFWACTFIHHVEQRMGVPYRYMKRLSGRVENGATHHVQVDYLVRDLGYDADAFLDPLAAALVESGAMRRLTLPRGPSIMVVAATEVESEATRRVAENSLFLIEQGHG